MYQPGIGVARAQGQEAEETGLFFRTVGSKVSSRWAICVPLSFISQTYNWPIALFGPNYL